MTSVRPLGDRVLVRRAPEEGVTDGGLILPDRSRTKPQRGEVVRLGHARKVVCRDVESVQPSVNGRIEYETLGNPLVPFQVAPGDTVYFNRYGGIEVEVEGEKLLLISETEILAYERPESPLP